jgi:L-fuconolactonase
MMPSGAIDTHTHFWDKARPVPPEYGMMRRFASPDRTIMPEDFEAVAKPHGIAGTVVVEASSWMVDNEWLLDVTKANKVVVGMLGSFAEVFGKATFATALEKFAKEPLFRGVRTGVNQLADTNLAANFEAMADADLMVDVNPDTAALPRLATAAKRLPKLRIVINHMANENITGAAPPAAWITGMQMCAEQPNIFLKVSRLLELGRPMGRGMGVTDPAHYKPALDAAWMIWGEDRVIFGTNWPVLENSGSFSDAMKIITTYMATKTKPQQDKFFAGNAKKVYKYVNR